MTYDGTLAYRSSSIAVLVFCKDAIVRAGVAATLMAAPGISVRVEEAAHVLDSEAALLGTIGAVHVVVADYDTAVTIAQVLKRKAFPRVGLSTPIMIVTPRDGEADVRRALETGIQGYLPLDSRRDEVIDGVIALHRGQRCLGPTVAQRMAESFGHEALTSREVDVLRFVVDGDANKLVAKKLSIALGTVKVHVRSIMSKLGARTRTEAAAIARRRGLCELAPEFDAVTPMHPHMRQSGSLQDSNSRSFYGNLRVVHRQ